MKKPWLAALLNVVPFPMGLGYLYEGRPGRFALAFLGAVAASGAGLVLLFLAFLAAWGGSDALAWAFLGLSPVLLLLLAGFTAWNAYALAPGTARVGWRQAATSALALVLLGIPVTLGALLVDPAGAWRKPVGVYHLAFSPAFASDRTLFADTYGGSFRSTDAGEIWQLASQGLPSEWVARLAFRPAFASGRTLFANAPEGIFRSTDAGTKWHTAGQGAFTPQSVLALSPTFATDRTLFVLTLPVHYRRTDEAGLLRSTDAGESWRDFGCASASWWMPATAFALGLVIAIVLAGALLASWNTGGLARLAGRWWPFVWAIAGLGTGVLLILLGFVDDTARLVYLGGSSIALLVMGFFASVAAQRFSCSLE